MTSSCIYNVHHGIERCSQYSVMTKFLLHIIRSQRIVTLVTGRINVMYGGGGLHGTLNFVMLHKGTVLTYVRSHNNTVVCVLLV